MTPREFEDQIVNLGMESGLSVSDISAAMSRAKSRLLKVLAVDEPNSKPGKPFKTLERPGGGLMSKKKRG